MIPANLSQGEGATLMVRFRDYGISASVAGSYLLGQNSL
jgi:hypothetical protein